MKTSIITSFLAIIAALSMTPVAGSSLRRGAGPPPEAASIDGGVRMAPPEQMMVHPLENSKAGMKVPPKNRRGGVEKAKSSGNALPPPGP